ncbi:zinc finger protein basonuclin-1-like isoform X1 [Schistocerca serialis cubense]|uniref:zinc finger protein basonuclin-1-like isoform X1 n=2 Tax=Schistocerca serialis cubense TaxID=2023355 RepID=UPI00214F24E4|nr:zinc finger protein basonuclin-1-like isoform X1 [Schistocerca serialis cubense]
MGTGEDYRLQAPRAEAGQSAPSPSPTGGPVEGGSRCCVPGCDCAAFTPSPGNGSRFCCACGHGWVPHAALSATATVEEVSGAVLLGYQALTIRLKILLDRLLSGFSRDEVLHLLAGFGWTLEDYARGYMLQDKYGKMLQRWHICSDEEEPLVLRRFLGFPETRGLAMKLMQPSIGPRSECGSSNENLLVAPFSGDLPLSLNGAPYERRPILKVLSPPSGATVCKTALPIPHPSPLYQLQNMQPLDFCKMERANGERLQQQTVQEEPGLINLSMPKFAEVPKWYREDADQMRTSYGTSTASLSRPSPPTSVFSEADKTSRGSSCLADSGDEDDDVENYQSAMNLSRDSSNGASHTAQEDTKRRAPSSPKRKWGSSLLDLPFNLATPVVNQVTGKKRVQCNVCLKTFCDKGALKIHFSAVHLREMHKCTVEGCNMMFSSRRSRNRHSANPNPKLHSPGFKRRTSPQEGRPGRLHALPLVAPAAAATVAGGCVDLSTHKYDEKIEDSWYQNADGASDNIRLRPLTNGVAIKTEKIDEPYGEYEKDEENSSVPFSFSASLCHPYTDKQKFSQGPYEENQLKEEFTDVKTECRSEDTHLDNLAKEELSDVKRTCVREDLSKASEQLPLRGVRKRKSRNPTRYGSCPKRTHVLSLESVASERDFNECVEQTITDGTYDAGRSDQQKCVAVISHTEETSEVREEKDRCVPVGDVSDIDTNLCTRKSEQSPENEEGCVEDNCKIPESGMDDYSCLESYSELVSDVKDNEEARSGREVVPRDTRNFINVEPEKCIATEVGEVTRDCSDPNSEVDEKTCIDDQLKMRVLEDTPKQSKGQNSDEACLASQIETSEPLEENRDTPSREIPMDKENPRRCLGCGKVFLNHFCVKTHYRNVHLRLQHGCTVPGCSATFPSKRSRDRHSANPNLHRRLQPEGQLEAADQ